MHKSTFIVCLFLVSCLVFSSCSGARGLNMGFEGMWIGELPAVHFGVKSNKTEFDINDVTLDFYYGDGSKSDAGGYIGKYREGAEYWEECPIVCIAVYFFNSKYGDELGEINAVDYRNIEGLYFVKEITVDDYNENYDVKNNILGSRYEHNETLTIPQETLELTTGYVCLGVYEIAYIPWENTYCIGSGSYQALKYEKLDNGTVRLSEPVGSHYADPKE